MELRRKLQILADAAKYDASCASSGAKRAPPPGGLGSTEGMGICHSYTPDGRCVSLLKVLLTNYCVFDCQYCVNRISSDTPRARFTVEEVVSLTVEFYRRNYIEGLFLSSGVLKSADHTMEQLVRVARTLRVEHAFHGYIHLKVVPGASPELITEAGRWADRLSANVELPTAADLERLAPQKSFAEVETTMADIRSRIDEARDERPRHQPSAPPSFAPAGQSTQLIVGATPTNDRAILQTASLLYARHRLRRVYYTAYSPIPHADARLPPKPPPLVREHRLYQADWLVRFYGFAAEEITPDDAPDLPLEMDPKLAWALRNRGFFPVDVNGADREALLRVPGIGARNVKRILRVRRLRRLTIDDLKRLGVALSRAKPFVIADGHNPDALRLDRIDLAERVRPAKPEQLDLFATATTARTGEL